MKGVLFTVEVSIAILMILAIIILIFRNPGEVTTFSAADYKLKAFDGLLALEKTGGLRKNAVNNNVAQIKSDIDPYIPDSLSYEVVIYNDTTNVTNFPSSITQQNNTAAVSYLLAGDLNNFTIREVRVFVWGFD